MTGNWPDHGCSGSVCRLCDARGVPVIERPGYTLARTTDPETSRKAAALLGTTAGTHRGMLLRAFAVEPLTAEEAASRAGLLVGTAGNYTKRVSDLTNAGYIAPTGQTRTGTSGRAARVLAITDAGRAAL
ncbi:MAG: hypothetical protein ACOYB3_01855 [Azonexus sp.]